MEQRGGQSLRDGAHRLGRHRPMPSPSAPLAHAATHSMATKPTRRAKPHGPTSFVIALPIVRTDASAPRTCGARGCGSLVRIMVRSSGAMAFASRIRPKPEARAPAWVHQRPVDLDVIPQTAAASARLQARRDVAGAASARLGAVGRTVAGDRACVLVDRARGSCACLLAVRQRIPRTSSQPMTLHSAGGRGLHRTSQVGGALRHVDAVFRLPRALDGDVTPDLALRLGARRSERHEDLHLSAVLGGRCKASRSVAARRLGRTRRKAERCTLCTWRSTSAVRRTRRIARWARRARSSRSGSSPRAVRSRAVPTTVRRIIRRSQAPFGAVIRCRRPRASHRPR